jgi:uncharacterized iron-regulated membrane protein
MRGLLPSAGGDYTFKVRRLNEQVGFSRGQGTRAKKDTFMHWMNQLHSWSGLLFGWLLFTVFLTGTLTVFDNEITAWMQPELQEVTSAARALDEASPHGVESNSQGYGVRWGVYVPTDVPPVLEVKLQEKRSFSGQTIDPATGAIITFRDTQGGDFFYHFHYGLVFGLPGAFIVGTGAMAMLIALGTGVVIRRRVFRTLFLFRPRSFAQRSWLDIHNLTSLIVLPFPLMIAFTGLMIFWSIYMPSDVQFLTGGDRILSFLSMLHFVQFGDTAIHWLYFVMGLGACAMIATGLILWSIKRQKYSFDRSPFNYRLVKILNVTTVAGLLVAVGAFFWANRLLPTALIDRSQWEVRCFFVVWGLCFIHSLLRGGSTLAWKNQLHIAALLFGLLPFLNGLTTRSHLLMTVPTGRWALASFDLTALAAGAILYWITQHIVRLLRRSANNAYTDHRV